MGSEESYVSMLKSESIDDLHGQDRTSGPNNNRLYGVSSFTQNRVRPQSFSATWSIIYPNTISPVPRYGHFTIYDNVSDVTIIGYGNDSNSNFCHDIWALGMKEYKWMKLNINLSQISPRYGTTAALYGKNVVCFGGKSGDHYLADLHVINLETKTVSIVQTPGDSPSGRIGHSMAIHGDKIVIWGGNNNAILDDLWIFDINKRKWTCHSTQFGGRTESAYASMNGLMYIGCSSKSDSILRYDFSSDAFDALNVTGNPPPFEMKSANLVAVDRYLILIGGILDNQKYTMIRAFDTVKNWWFVFHVSPDGETTTTADGSVDSNGIFMVPRTSHSSMIYRKETREVVIFLGQPTIDPPPLYVLKVGESLAYLHLQNDMFEMLKTN